MSRRYLWLVVIAVVVLAAALVLASCGSSATTTTAAPAGSSTTAGVTTTAAGGTVDAAALYAANCQVGGCHETMPVDSVDKVTTVIQQGVEGMPGFADKLTAAQIAALAAWVANGGK